MKANVGGIDRILRLVLGGALVIWAVLSGNAWGYLGAIPILTALTGRCPVYLLLRSSSRNRS
jgi:hypothetical protein